jgi:hypothetical protein
MNGTDWAKLTGRDVLRILAAHDVLRAGPLIVAARGDTAGEQ